MLWRHFAHISLVMALVMLPLLGLTAADKAASKKAADKDKLPKADDITKGMKLVGDNAFFRMYQKKSKLFLEIPNKMMGKEFFLATSFAGGNSYHGWQWSDMLVAWERYENKLLLVEKDVRYRATEGTPVGEAVNKTYSDRILLNLPIKGEARGGNRGYVIDGKALLADKAKTFFGSMAGGLDSSLAKWKKLKPFPDNCEIAVTMPRRSDGTLITLHYSMARLKKSSYKPRVADDRVGYFLTAYKDFSKGDVANSRFVRNINRWNLQKQDKSLDLSPPKEPIIFYIEKTVPVKFRRYVREGILEWNKAFEKIGFDSAIEVRQQTDSQFQDLDPEDSRFNFFRWITSERAFAMGPSRVNPRTGEILDADVIFDDSMARWYLTQYDRLLKDIPQTFFSPNLRKYFRDNPEEHPFAHCGLPGYDSKSVAEMPIDGEHDHEFPASARAHCSYGTGITHQLAMAGVAYMVLNKDGVFGEIPAEYIGPAIREVVMHEIGHTLGLRHNFKASTWKDLNTINTASLTAATVGSVMDYTPINVVPSGEQQQYITGTLGPYDDWAIEYGYATGKSDEDLKKIAARGASEGLDYGTDEDVWTGDPTISRYDLSSDPLEYARQRLELMHKLLPSVVDRVVQDGEGYQKARQTFGMLLRELTSAGRTAANYVGGAYVHRDHKGDPDARPPLQVVPAEKQREALDLLCSKVLAEDAITLDPELLTHLAAGRWSHWGTMDSFSTLNYPVLEQLLSVQSAGLSMVLNPETLGRVRNNELKVNGNEKPVTIPEVLNTLTKSMFSELDGGRVEITAMRENLQRNYVQRLIRMTLRSSSWGPAILQALAREQLSEIAERVEGSVSNAGNDYTKAHLQDLKRRISKALDANYSAG